MRRSSAVVVAYHLVDNPLFVEPVQTFCKAVVHSLNQFILYCNEATRISVVLFPVVAAHTDRNAFAGVGDCG